MSRILWKAPFNVCEKAYYLQQQLDNYEISREEFAEQMANLPGYPLKRLLRQGDDLVILVQPKPMALVKPAHTIH